MSIIRGLSLSRVAVSSRTFATTPIAAKSLTESVKDVADSVNKKVGQTLAAGIDKTESAANSAKATASDAAPTKGDAQRAAGSAQETAESVRQNANQALGAAAGKARDASDEVKKNI